MRLDYQALFAAAYSMNNPQSRALLTQHKDQLLFEAKRELADIQKNGTCGGEALAFPAGEERVNSNPKAIMVLYMAAVMRAGQSIEVGLGKETWKDGLDNGERNIIQQISVVGSNIARMTAQIPNDTDRPTIDVIQNNIAGLNMPWPAAVLQLEADAREAVVGQQRSWKERVEVSKVRTAAFWEDVKKREDMAMAEALESGLAPDGTANPPQDGDAENTAEIEEPRARAEITVLDSMMLRTIIVFKIVQENFNKNRPAGVPELDDDVVEEISDAVSDEIYDWPSLDVVNGNEEYMQRAFRYYNTPELKRAGAKYAKDLDLEGDYPFGSAGIMYNLLHQHKEAWENMSEENEAQALKNWIAIQKVYIAKLEMYEKLERRQKEDGYERIIADGQAPPHDADEIRTYIAKCKVKLAVVEALSAHDNFHAQRAAGAGIGAAAGLLLSAGAATGIAFASDAKVAEFALEALQDIFKGSFDKLGQGLAAGNPILWAVVGGACLGLITMAVGIISTAEVASHMRDRSDALRYFEGKVNEKAAQLVQAAVSARE